MRVQVIQLDPHDDQVSARDKLAWVKSPRVLLIWPPEGRPLSRRLDLVLLQREAQRRGAQLGLVSQDPDVLDNAEWTGVPVFSHADHLPESTWGRYARRRSRAALRIRSATAAPAIGAAPRSRGGPPAGVRWQAGAAAMSALALAGVFAVVFPTARIWIAPMTTSLSVERAVVLDPQLEGPGPSGTIPALELTRTLSGELRLPTTGRTEVATSFAEGEIQVVNLTSEDQTIPAGISVRPAGREDLYFLTLRTLVLAGEEIGFVEIRAAQPGPIGNLGGTQIDSVDGPSGLVVSVTNPEPIQGGAETLRASPTPEDRSRLYNQLGAQLVEQARLEWDQTLPQGTVLHLPSVRVARVLSEEYTVDLGVPADSHALRIEMQVSALAYRQDDLRQAARQALDSDRRPDEVSVPDSLEVASTSGPTHPDRADALQITASEQSYRQHDLRELARALAGRSLVEARAAIQGSLDLASPPIIELTPAWWPRMPFLPIQIEVAWVWDR